MKSKKNRAAAKTAALGTVATAALFSLQHQAESGIIYSGIRNITASAPNSGSAKVNIDVDGGGTRDLQLQAFAFSSVGDVGILGAVLQFDNPQLRQLASGSRISAAVPGGFVGFGQPRLVKALGTASNSGFWNTSNVPALAGFRFRIGADTHYGWIRLKWNDNADANAFPDSITAINWAYDDTANFILAGATSSAAVPEPSSALLFLAGAGGLALIRRRAAKKRA